LFFLLALSDVISFCTLLVLSLILIGVAIVVLPVRESLLAFSHALGA
jgi:hypothetical protein